MQAKTLPPTLADSVPSSPLAHLTPVKDMKDLPPHLAGVENGTPVVHDLRQEISSLVDHVRHMAMDQNRPDSPGIHIDWAGEDDDSLPDLDDWFTNSKRPSDTSESETKTDEIVETKPPTLEVTINIEAEHLEPAVPAERSLPTELQQPQPEEKQVPEADRAPARRERKRERGRGRNASSLKVDAAAKKSLLERLSSPVEAHSDRVDSSEQSDAGPEGRAPQFAGRQSLKELPAFSQPIAPSPDKPEDRLAEVPRVSTEKETATKVQPGGTDPAARITEDAKSVTEQLKNARSFDWSDEPVSFDAPLVSEVPRAPIVDINPPTPLAETAPLLAPPTSSPASLSVRDRPPRTRSQRPMSSDNTHRPARDDRLPHKTHNPRNHSMPHVSLSGAPNGRTRQPHATRPVLRVDALNMIARNLRETPTGKRSSSPNTQTST